MENNNLITKTLAIEKDTWVRIKEIIWEKSSKNEKTFNNPSKVLNLMLLRFKEENIKLESSKLEKKTVQVNLSKEANEIYNSLTKGGRSHIINGLLRFWIKENN